VVSSTFVELWYSRSTQERECFFFFGGSLATRELSKNVFYFLLSSTILSTELVFFLPVARDVNSLTDPSHSRRQRTRGNFGF